ncbi:MAG: AarF/UbiB family protein [Candidatus Woesearchaeota archaeon]|nr:AarF/UbiB family protein [Candidatus Woesearchaeota archaeon]
MDDIKRIQQVIRVLEKHGLARPLANIGMHHHLSLRRRHQLGVCRNVPFALRTACEELGGVFVQLVLFLGSRPDLVPLAYSREFRLAKNHEKPLPFKIIAPIIKDDCGTEIFEYINPVAFSSTSFTQSYHARLKNTEKVVIKVLKPGVSKQIHEELLVLHYFSSKLYEHIPWKWNEILEEFESNLNSELNLLIRAKQWESAQGIAQFVVPKTHWEFSSARILVRQFLPGGQLRYVHPQTKKIVSRMLAEHALSKGILPERLEEHLLIMPNGKIGFFHSIYLLNKKELEHFRAIMASIQHKKPFSLHQALLVAGTSTEQTKHVALGEQLSAIIQTPNETTTLACALDECLSNKLAVPAWLGRASASMSHMSSITCETVCCRTTNRLSFAFLAGACLIVAALISNKGPAWYSFPFISLFALAGGIIFTVLLFKEIYSSSRKA